VHKYSTTLAKLIKDNQISEWLTGGVTLLISKNENTDRWNKHWPATCLPTIYKILNNIYIYIYISIHTHTPICMYLSFYCKNNTCFYNLANISTLKIIMKQKLYNIKMMVNGHFCHEEISSLKNCPLLWFVMLHKNSFNMAQTIYAVNISYTRSCVTINHFFI
jgi:hypothetical protein